MPARCPPGCAPAGSRAPGDRHAGRRRPARRRGLRRPACGPPSTAAARSSGPPCVGAGWPRCPTCWWSGPRTSRAAGGRQPARRAGKPEQGVPIAVGPRSPARSPPGPARGPGPGGDSSPPEPRSALGRWRRDYIVEATERDRRRVGDATPACSAASRRVARRRRTTWCCGGGDGFRGHERPPVPERARARHAAAPRRFAGELTGPESADVGGPRSTPWPPSRGPTSPTGSTWAPTSAGPPVRASRPICTCMRCPAGRATPTS